MNTRMYTHGYYSDAHFFCPFLVKQLVREPGVDLEGKPSRLGWTIPDLMNKQIFMGNRYEYILVNYS